MLEDDKAQESSTPEEEVNFAPSMMAADEDLPPEASISWTAPEFLSHEKTGVWFVGLTLITIIATGVFYLTTHSIVTAAAIIVGGLMLGVYGGREPRQLEYRLGHSSLSIGDRQFPYENFRAFSIIKDGDIVSIDFMPLKRFSPILTVYFHPDDEAAITNLLSSRLPYEARKLDAIERLMRNLHF
jgi:hypothetical protein